MECSWCRCYNDQVLRITVVHGIYDCFFGSTGDINIVIYPAPQDLKHLRSCASYASQIGAKHDPTHQEMVDY